MYELRILPGKGEDERVRSSHIPNSHIRDLVQSLIRSHRHCLLPTPQDIINPARQPYIPDASTFGPVEKVANRETWLNPIIHDLPKKWLKYLKAPLTSPTTRLRCFELYPLDHHRRILFDWDIAHPGEYHPCEMRWNLTSLRGDIEDDCYPSYFILTLIAAAISGSPEGKATNKEIRLALMLRYNYFITQSTFHEEVNLILKHYPLYFESHPRRGNSADSGCLWGLTEGVARVIADTAGNLPHPPPPIEPSVNLNFPKELDSHRTIITGPASEYLDPAKKKPRRLDVDDIKSGWHNIPRQQLDILVRQEGRDLLRKWADESLKVEGPENNPL